MAQVFYIHPDNPQQRLLEKAASVLNQGGLIVYPNDTSYALACKMGSREALERLRQVRGLDDKHLFTLLCRDLSDIGHYGKVNNAAFRLIKQLAPGPFTFLLKAEKDVPRRLLAEKRKVIGVRMPDHKIAQGLLSCVGEPLLTSSLLLPDQTEPLTEPYEIIDAWDHFVDAIIDGGIAGNEQTTVVDLQEDLPQVIRQGKGIISGI